MKAWTYNPETQEITDHHGAVICRVEDPKLGRIIAATPRLQSAVYAASNLLQTELKVADLKHNRAGHHVLRLCIEAIKSEVAA